MQAHQRYFPLGGQPLRVRRERRRSGGRHGGNGRSLENRLDDADFTFDRDLAGRDRGARARLGEITFFRGAGSFADKTDEDRRARSQAGRRRGVARGGAARKADQASELVREYPDLEGHIGAEYARLAGYPEAVCAAIDEQYLPDGQDAPLPQTEAGKVLSAADKIDTLTTAFELGHKPTGSRDPYGLRRAAIGICRLADPGTDDGGLTIPRELLPEDVRDFVEERLESLLDVPVEFVRAARAAAVTDLGSVGWLARQLASMPEEQLGPIHTVYTRAARIVGDSAGEVDPALLAEDAEVALARALQSTDLSIVAARNPEAFAAAANLAPVVERFFKDVLVMAEDSGIRANRLALLGQVRDEVGRLGDLSQIPR